MNALVLNLLSHDNSRQAFERLLNNEIITNIIAVEFNYKINNDKIKIINFNNAINGDVLSDDEIGEVDGRLLEKLFECEAIFLKMYDRFDYSNESNYQIRKDYYLKQVANWNKFFHKEKVDICFFSNFPHELYDYVIYFLCKVKNIKTIIVDELVMLPNTVFLIENFKEHNLELKNRNNLFCHKQTLRRIEYNKTIAESRTPKLPAGIIWQKGQDKFYSSFKGRFKHLLKSIPKILKNYKLILNSKYAYLYNPYLICKNKKIFDLYNQLAVIKPNLNNKYIYFPLHYQPECTTSPQGGVYVEQYLIAQMIVNTMPPGFTLYIKEHPLQKLHGRYKSLYENLSKLPNTYLIDRSYSSFELLTNAYAVATVTGTAGWEGILNGVSVLNFGYSYYMYAPNVYTINSNEDLRKAYPQLNEKYNNEYLSRFIDLIDNYSVNTWVHGFNINDNIVNVEKAVDNLYLGLIKVINKNND